MRKFFLLLFLVSSVAKAAITTPYPESIVLNQINSAEKERIRLCQGMQKCDKQPTGFYIDAGKTVEVNVEILTPADQNVMPTLFIGTMGFNVDGRNTGISTTLKAGVNTISASAGGLIWLSFVNNGTAEPKGQARITFTANSEQVRAPYYVYGVTTDLEFYEMWNTYQTPDVLFQSDYIAVAATRDAARLYSCYNREGTVLKEWMDAIHTLLAKEDEISGLDNNDPNPIHHRLKTGEIRFLLVENTSSNPFATNGYTGYPSSSRSRYLTKIGTPSNNSWMLGHENGHHHQQPAYQINLSTESTVNIYSYVVERNIQGPGYTRTSATRWAQVQDTYLKLPVSKRVYDMPDAQMTAITGFDQNELRFMTWEQMFLIFGDRFYQTLHRVVREEKMSAGSGVADERRAYLIWKASEVSGYDLTEYYNQWGIRVTDPGVKALLRARIGNALATGAIVPLPVPVEDCVTITGQNPPDWAPLPLTGITTSFPDNAVAPIDRSNWTITTSINGATDATVGGDDPKYIIDGNQTTAFSFVKPGVTYGVITAPADYVPSFTVDMQSEQSFNYVSYLHRNAGNTSTYIRARQISVYGSDDNSEFTPIYEHYVIDYTKNLNEIIIEFPEVTYRYIKVVIEDWDKNSGSTVQVAEFNAGIKTPAEVLPTPDPLQFRVTVTADDFVVTSQRGVNLEDEDSNYTVNFSLAPDAKDLVVTVDGDTVTPALNGDVYSLTVKVTNHIDVNITGQSVTGVESPAVQPQTNIYPNPAKAEQPFYISLNDGASDAVVNVYSALGEKLSEKKISAGFGEQTINKPGMYMIEVIKNESKRVFKLIIN